MIPPLAKVKVCETCGKPYQPVSNRQRYCTRCGRRGGRKICETCGIEFQKVANTTGRFCSRACRSKALAVARERACSVCGQRFSTSGPADPQKTCSPACADLLKAKSRPKCKTCGKTVGRPHNRFCSHRCALLGTSRNQGTREDGTKHSIGSGYFAIKINGRWIPEHRHVMEQKLGRSLEAYERVHHLNGNRSDNRPENLELWKVKSPKGGGTMPGVRAADYHCPGCRCFEHD